MVTVRIALSVLVVVLATIVCFALVASHDSRGTQAEAHRPGVLTRQGPSHAAAPHRSTAPPFRVLRQGRIR